MSYKDFIKKLFNKQTNKQSEAYLAERQAGGNSLLVGTAYSQLESLYLNQNPGEQLMCVRPVSSASNANGYMYVCSREYYDLLDEMCDRDTTIAGCVELIVAYMLMRPMGLKIKEADADNPAANDSLAFVEDYLFNKTNWNYLLWALCEGMLRHGRSTIEITWRVTQDGYYVPAKFWHCHPGQFTFDREGKMYYRSGKDNGEFEPVTPLKFMSACRPAMYDNPYGDSLIYPCRFIYQFKKQATVYRLRAAETAGEPIIHATVKTTGAGVGTNPAASQSAVAEALRRIGRDNFAVSGEDVDLNFHNRTALSSGGVHQGIITDFDEAIVLFLLGATLQRGTADNGNRALGEVHERRMINLISPPARIVEQVINDELIAPLIAMNKPGAPVPYLEIDTEEATDAEAARATLETAVKVGLIVAASEARDNLGYREPLPDEETIGGAGFTPLARAGTTEKTKIVDISGADDSLLTAKQDNMQEDEQPAQFDESEPVTSYGCAMLNLGTAAQAAINGWLIENVDAEDVINIPSAAHVTVLYGIAAGVTGKDVSRAAMGINPVLTSYGGLRYFETPDADVLYLQVVDVWGDLGELRKALKQGVAHVPEAEASFKTGSDYTPHVTLAYLRKGTGCKYAALSGNDFPHGKAADSLQLPAAMLNSLVFSDSLENVTVRILTGERVSFSGRNLDAERLATDMADVQERTDKMLAGRVLTVDMWNDDTAALELKRAEVEAALTETLLIKMAEELAADAVEPQKEVFKQTRDNIAAAGYDPQSVITRNVFNAIDPSPMLDYNTLAAQVSVYGTFLLTYGYYKNITATARAMREESQTPFGFAENEFTLDAWDSAFSIAADWMLERGIMTRTQLQMIAAEMARETGTDRAIIEEQLRRSYLALKDNIDYGAVAQMQKWIADGVLSGSTVDEFLMRMDTVIGSTGNARLDSYWRMVFRTEVSKAYGEQQAAQEANPAYQEVLWGHLGGNPNDKRSRETHADTDGVFFRKDSLAWRLLGLTPYSYNCRCYRTPVVDPDPANSRYEETPGALGIAMAVERW